MTLNHPQKVWPLYEGGSNLAQVLKKNRVEQSVKKFGGNKCRSEGLLLSGLNFKNKMKKKNYPTRWLPSTLAAGLVVAKAPPRRPGSRCYL
jgi:hypothetical protein